MPPVLQSKHSVMDPSPAKLPWTHLLCILLASAISIAWAVSIARASDASLADLRSVFYGTRCVLRHLDPYRAADFLKVYQAESGQFPRDPALSHIFLRSLLVCVNLPASLFLLLPLAGLPWAAAQAAWMILLSACFVLSGLVAWSFARTASPRLALFLVCLALANGELVLALGNLAGIAVSLCIVAVWCFLRNRYVAAGIVCLALSLAVKPHDAGLLWLYFLLAGGVQRKRALWTLSLTAAIALCAALWIAPVSPRWPSELHANLQAVSAPGDLNDPGPQSLSRFSSDAIVDLQSLLSVFCDDPRFYNPAAWLLCGAGLLLWLSHTIRLRCARVSPWLALAPLVPLTLLVAYHRPHDAKLVLLTIPACAIVWSRGGALRWPAAIVTTLALLCTGDIPLAVAGLLAQRLPPGSWPAGAIALLSHPAPIALSLLAAFYLWLYCARARDYAQ